MKEIGYRRALVIHGLSADGKKGMDEASTLGETLVAELKEDGSIHRYSFLPEDLGIKRGRAEELQPAAETKLEARRMVRLLSGAANGARREIACLNGGLILYLMGVSGSIKEGYHDSLEIIRSGRAIQKLQDWVKAQNRNPEAGLAKLRSLME